jgi:hypothetical protein
MCHRVFDIEIRNFKTYSKSKNDSNRLKYIELDIGGL